MCRNIFKLVYLRLISLAYFPTILLAFCLILGCLSRFFRRRRTRQGTRPHLVPRTDPPIRRAAISARNPLDLWFLQAQVKVDCFWDYPGSCNPGKSKSDNVAVNFMSTVRLSKEECQMCVESFAEKWCIGVPISSCGMSHSLQTMDGCSY